MVHVIGYSTTGENCFFRYNIDSHVGKGKPNKLEDVELVRLGYYLMGRNSKATGQLTPEEKAALAKIKPSGAFGDDLDAAIRAHERSRGGAQDGFVSPLPSHASQTKERYDGKHSWIMAVIDNNLADKNRAGYPRIDQYPECGAALRGRIRAIFGVNT